MPKMKANAIIKLLPRLIKHKRIAQTYNVYIAECLRMLTENTAKISGGAYLKVKYEDIINPPKEEKRTPEEIIDKISDKLKKIGG